MVLVLLLAGGLAMPGCGPTDRVETVSPEIEEHLQALGYVAWSENAEGGKQGVTLFDRTRAADGYNLYTNDEDEIYLTDLTGRRMHSWRVPTEVFGERDPNCEDAQLLKDGRLLVVCSRSAVVLLDRASTILSYVKGGMHHDAALLGGGRLLVIHALPSVRYRGRSTIFDALSIVSARGEVEEAWSTLQQRDALRKLHRTSSLDVPLASDQASKATPYDYYHLNSVQILPDTELGRRDRRFRAGNWLVCLRNVDLVIVLDATDRAVTWSWGPGELDLPHMPRMLPNGNMLIFDNGKHRGFSRVLELEPDTLEIAWQYQAQPPENFFSAWRGGAQRLANGNTLIAESETGRAFEVTSGGDLVWEFWNPEIADGKRKRFYRFRRVSLELGNEFLGDDGA